MIEERLSDDIESGARARPRYSTDIVTSDSGHEVRNSLWAYPLFQFEFNLAPADPESDIDFQEFYDLFHAAGGPHETFLFRHWFDYQGTMELLGVGDGVETQFQLVRNYTRGLITRTRKITRPAAGTVTVYKNGVEQLAGITVDYETGLVDFTLAPSSGQEVRASFEFDVPVRFEDDTQDFIGFTPELTQPVNIVLVEVRE